MPTADKYNPEGRNLIALDGEAADVQLEGGVRLNWLRLAHLRHMQWGTETGRNGERAEVLDAAFDELEVRR